VNLFGQGRGLGLADGRAGVPSHIRAEQLWLVKIKDKAKDKILIKTCTAGIQIFLN